VTPVIIEGILGSPPTENLIGSAGGRTGSRSARECSWVRMGKPGTTARSCATDVHPGGLRHPHAARPRRSTHRHSPLSMPCPPAPARGSGPSPQSPRPEPAPRTISSRGGSRQEPGPGLSPARWAVPVPGPPAGPAARGPLPGRRLSPRGTARGKPRTRTTSRPSPPQPGASSSPGRLAAEAQG